MSKTLIFSAASVQACFPKRLRLSIGDFKKCSI
jgi:hypothetical protein